ncbi:MAG TPA: hypothetical protein VFG04_04180 [Planctomycetaceae bacterium]|jgi:hypothetical protein|nr:hypothetical protein [Planctomycetaceae bacterium]
MLRRFVMFSILGVGSLGALVIAKEEPSENRQGIMIHSTTTPNGPAIQIEVGDRVLLVPSLTVRGKNPDDSYPITVATDGKLRIPEEIFKERRISPSLQQINALHDAKSLVILYRLPTKRESSQAPDPAID